jgi:hypothetical protein
MNYTLIKIPKELDKSFFKMNKKEAQFYFDWFLNIKEERLKLLNRAIIESNVKEWKFNFTMNSLTPLFNWFKSSITTRNKTQNEIKMEEEKITGFLKEYIDVGEKTFTDETVSICFDVSIYFGEVLKREKNLEWSFVLKPKRYVDFAQPILVKKGAKMRLNPRRIIENVARDILDKSFEENELIKLYNVWKGYF